MMEKITERLIMHSACIVTREYTEGAGRIKTVDVRSEMTACSQ